MNGLTEVTSPCRGQKGSLLVAVMEWLEDHHEWHLHENESDQTQTLLIWDQQRGYRSLSEFESGEVYRQAARILTLYYDLASYCQIYPWHHAAGDFILKTGSAPNLRLTTVRKYDSIMGLWEKGKVTPTIAAVYFFLNLTVRMRLDRQDGTGRTLWADKRFLQPVVDGFLEGLAEKAKASRKGWKVIRLLPIILQSFDPGEIKQLLFSLCPLYENDDPEEYSMINKTLPLHADELYHILRKREKPVCISG
jgi:hypothetical protein